MAFKFDEPTIETAYAHEELRKVGEVLYGQFWKSQMARDTGYSARSIRHYAAGTRQPPLELFSKLFDIANRRRGEVGDAVMTLSHYRMRYNVQLGRHPHAGFPGPRYARFAIESGCSKDRE